MDSYVPKCCNISTWKVEPRPLSKQPVAFPLRSRGEKKTFPPAIENRPYLNVELSNEHFHKYVSRAVTFSAFPLGVRKPFLFFFFFLFVLLSTYLFPLSTTYLFFLLFSLGFISHQTHNYCRQLDTNDVSCIDIRFVFIRERLILL